MSEKQAKPTILVVDDTPANIAILVEILRDDYRLRVAKDGEKGLEQARKAPVPDLILLDVMMPGIDGYEVCRQLKADPQTAEVPIVFVTALTEVENESQGFALGAVDYITKPFNADIVKARARTHVTIHLLQKEIAQRNAENEALLLNILPEPVANRLKAGESTIADSFPSATVLFADLVGFTGLAGRMSPEDLVAILNRVFSEFDALASRFGVEKIKTVGDCYFAVSGVPTPRVDHADAAADLALGIRDAIGPINTDLGVNLQLRIGLHTGPLVAGVIGTTKFSYDLWGDTVNLASRMETTAATNEIRITQDLAEHLADRYVVVASGEEDVKGKGPMPVFVLRSKA